MVIRPTLPISSAVAFKALTSRLARQFAQYEPIPGIHLNGEATVGENICALGGLNSSLEA